MDPELPERYELRRVLGQGGMGRVVLAWDRELERTVALKQVLQSLEGDDLRDRFLREARMLAQLEHPRVVRLLDFGLHRGQPWFSMEVLEGRSVLERYPVGGMPPEEVRALLIAILEALEALHGAGLLHRDLSAGNVFLDRHRGPVLIDFGLARVDQDERLTATGSVVGSPAFLAPELLRGAGYSVQSDLFSAARVAFDALCDVDAFTGLPRPQPLTLAKIMGALSSRTYLDVARRALQEQGALGKVLVRALDPDPQRRYPDARALRAALEATPPTGPAPDRTQALPVEARPGPEASPPPARPAASRPWAAAAALLLVGFCAGVGFEWQPPQPVAEPWPVASPGAPTNPAPPPPLPPLDLDALAEELQERLPIQVLDPYQEHLADLEATPGTGASVARAMLSTGSIGWLSSRPGFRIPLPLFQPSGGLNHWALYNRIVHAYGLAQVGRDPQRAAELLRWLPPELRPGQFPPEGTRVFTADLSRAPGLWARTHGEDAGLKAIQSGGRLQGRLRLRLDLPEAAEGGRVWFVLYAPDLDEDVLVRMQVNEVTPGSALGGFHLLAPAGSGGLACHVAPAWAVRPGTNEFELELRSYRNPGRNLPELDRFEVHLSR